MWFPFNPPPPIAILTFEMHSHIWRLPVDLGKESVRLSVCSLLPDGERVTETRGPSIKNHESREVKAAREPSIHFGLFSKSAHRHYMRLKDPECRHSNRLACNNACMMMITRWTVKGTGVNLFHSLSAFFNFNNSLSTMRFILDQILVTNLF